MLVKDWQMVQWGTVMGLVFKQNNILHAILVKSDSDKIGCDAKCNSKYKHIDTDSVPIVQIEVSFSVHKIMWEYQEHNFHFFFVGQSPFINVRGMTLPENVVDMSARKGKFRGGQAYVAFSRVTSLDKFHILNYTSEQIQVTNNIEEQMSRNGIKILPKLPKPMISTIDKTFMSYTWTFKYIWYTK